MDKTVFINGEAISLGEKSTFCGNRWAVYVPSVRRCVIFQCVSIKEIKADDGTTVYLATFYPNELHIEPNELRYYFEEEHRFGKSNLNTAIW